MLPDSDFSKASSAYQPNQPLGGIASGMSNSSPLPMGTGQSGSPTGGGLYNYNAATNSYASKPAGDTQNDNSLTNSYMNALKSQQGATAAAQSLSGSPVPDPNAPQSALPNFTPEQQKQFQTMFGAMMGMPQAPGATPGLSAVTPATTPPAMATGDNSRFANDPFKTNANALR